MGQRMGWKLNGHQKVIPAQAGIQYLCGRGGGDRTTMDTKHPKTTENTKGTEGWAGGGCYAGSLAKWAQQVERQSMIFDIIAAPRGQ